MTATEILLRWIETALARSEGQVVFRSSDVQTKVPDWGDRLFGEKYSPNNFIRRFREVKSGQSDRLEGYNIDSIIEVPSDSRESLWQATATPNRVLRDHEHRAPTSAPTTSGS